MREKTYHLYLNEEERSRVIQSLIELKNNLAAQGRYTDAVDDTQVDIKDNSWSFEAGLRTCQNNSSSIRYGGKGISFIRKNGHILRGGEHICRQRVYS